MTYATVSSRNFLILPLLTTVHSLHYVQIGFRTFRTDIKPNWNNYNNRSNVPTTFCLSQMKRFLAHSTSWICSKIRLTSVCTSARMEVCFLLGPSARICKENLWFDRKRFEIWLVNTGHVKAKSVFAGEATRSWQLLQLFSFLIRVRAGGLFSWNRLLLYYFEPLFTAATCY